MEESGCEPRRAPEHRQSPQRGAGGGGRKDCPRASGETLVPPHSDVRLLSSGSEADGPAAVVSRLVGGSPRKRTQRAKEKELCSLINWTKL